MLLREEELLLAHDFTGFGPWSVGSMGLDGASQYQELVAEVLFSHLDRGRKEGLEGLCNLQSHAWYPLSSH